MKPPIMRGLAAASAFALGSMAAAMPIHAEHRQSISNDPANCSAKAGPAIKVTINGIRSSSGTLRVQSYRATKDDWLEKGHWINRIEMPAKAGTMTVCMPLPASGTYGIAVRHDLNDNGKTDITRDGGGMSNNPSINIFNLGRPSYKKVGVTVTEGVRPIVIDMKYM